MTEVHGYRVECLISGCTWHEVVEPPVEFLPVLAPEITDAVERRADRAHRQHAETHPVTEWAIEVATLQHRLTCSVRSAVVDSHLARLRTGPAVWQHGEHDVDVMIREVVPGRGVVAIVGGAVVQLVEPHDLQALAMTQTRRG